MLISKLNPSCNAEHKLNINENSVNYLTHDIEIYKGDYNVPITEYTNDDVYQWLKLNVGESYTYETVFYRLVELYKLIGKNITVNHKQIEKYFIVEKSNDASFSYKIIQKLL